MTDNRPVKDLILAYLKALDQHQFDVAMNYLNSSVKVIGPNGEGFTNPTDFIAMMKGQAGKYEIKKVFVDGNDVCALYYFSNEKTKAFMSSWYQIKDDKISYIQTVFDSKLFN